MSQARITGKFFGAGALIALTLALLPGPAEAQGTPQDFVQSSLQNAITILDDKSLAPEARRDRIHTFLLSLLDTRRIALFTLGPVAQTASAQDLTDYVDAFRDFMVANYDARLGGFSGQTLRATATATRGPGDYVVSAELSDPSSSGATPQEVDFRVVEEEGKFYVVDAGAQGVWLAPAQRDAMQSYLKEHDNDLPALTAHLRDMTASLMKSAAAN